VIFYEHIFNQANNSTEQSDNNKEEDNSMICMIMLLTKIEIILKIAS